MGWFLETLLGVVYKLRVDPPVIFLSACLMPLASSVFIYSLLVALGTPKIKQERKL